MDILGVPMHENADFLLGERPFRKEVANLQAFLVIIRGLPQFVLGEAQDIMLSLPTALLVEQFPRFLGFLPYAVNLAVVTALEDALVVLFTLFCGQLLSGPVHFLLNLVQLLLQFLGGGRVLAVKVHSQTE